MTRLTAAQASEPGSRHGRWIVYHEGGKDEFPWYAVLSGGAGTHDYDGSHFRTHAEAFKCALAGALMTSENVVKWMANRECPVCGGDVHQPADTDYLVCSECREMLTLTELVWEANDDTRRAYAAAMGHDPDTYGTDKE